MKTLLVLTVTLLSANTFASFNVFQCTSKNVKISKSQPYKENLEYQDLANGYPVEHLNIENQSPEKPGRNGKGDTQTFPFRLQTYSGKFYLHSLVITENTPNAGVGTGILYRVNENGVVNTIIEKNMNCVME